MRNSKFFKLTTALLVPIILSVGSFSSNKNIAKKVFAYSPMSLPTTIDLNAVKENDIRNYYSSIKTSNNQGVNLLKALKPILKNNQTYFSYDTRKDDIWSAYEITDRDWTLSPASQITNGEYDAETNTIKNYKYKSSTGNDASNPYLHALYVNRDAQNPMRAWGEHSQTYGGINQEHIWPKSHGFKDAGDGGARGDLMHLWAADGYSNNLHNNFSYGYVDKNKSYTDSGSKMPYAVGNYRGTSLTLGSGTVFEPQDSDKGDVARALFYMAARYNNYAGETSGINTNDPYLVLSDYVGTESGTSTASQPMKYGILSDLLEWNKIDPVDEYEIKRNDILYRNFTHNRNPFIDFPQWADAIWGDDEKVANPSTDVINNKKEEVVQKLVSIEVTTQPAKTVYYLNEVFNPIGMVVTGTYDDGSTAVIKNFQYTSTPFETSGEQTITISCGEIHTQITVNVIEKLNLPKGIYTFTITSDDFNGSGYTANNIAKSSDIYNAKLEDSGNVYWFSNNVMKNGGIQFNKNGGIIYSTIPLESIKSIEITYPEKNNAEFNIYYGAEINPSISKEPGGRYFSISNVNGKTGYISSIKVTFEITGNPLVTGIELGGEYKKSFRVYDSFNSNGLKVYSIYDNGSSKEETVFEVIQPSLDSVGEDEVEVRFTNSNKEVFTATYDIEVTNYATQIKLYGTENISFKYGDNFTHSSVKAYLLMRDGEEIDITSDVTFSKPSLTSIGEKTVTVTYNKNGYNFSSTYKIKVVNYVADVELSGDYTTEFIAGESFNSDGLTLTLYYADGSTKVITSGFTVTGPKGILEEGEKTVTVKYVSDGKTFKKTYTIYINEPLVDLIVGCLGSTATSTSILFVLSLLGVSLLIYRIKEKN